MMRRLVFVFVLVPVVLQSFLLLCSCQSSSPSSTGGGGVPTVVWRVDAYPVVVTTRIPSRRGGCHCTFHDEASRLRLTSRRQQSRLCRRHRTPTCLATFPIPTSMVSLTDLSETTIWTIRLVSLLFSYIGAVAWVDRPRGELFLSSSLSDHETPSSVLLIRPSTVPGGGLGLFATENLPKGTVLGTYPGVLIPLTRNLEKLRLFPCCEGYIWRFSDNAFVIDPTNDVGVLDEQCLGGSPWSYPGSSQLFRAVSALVKVPTALCRINEPPRGRDVNVITTEDITRRVVTFELERTVYAGEELFIDYGLSYDRSFYGGEGQNAESPPRYDESA